MAVCVIGQILFVLNALLIIIFVFVETRRAIFKLINGVINFTKLLSFRRLKSPLSKFL